MRFHGRVETDYAGTHRVGSIVIYHGSLRTSCALLLGLVGSWNGGMHDAFMLYVILTAD